jgi:DNA polymerase-3 subunit gamma/tau
LASEVLYRKWRPRAFAELGGQEAVVRTLTNAIASGKIAHAYLFSGPRGTGKTTTGRLLAKAVNCTNSKGGEPCNECESCVAYLANAPEKQAFQFIELDAASNRGIDEIRNLREKAVYGGGNDAYKVYLVDEVHMLTEPAFNALLKTLEEPPAHVIFVLATTEAHKVPATVASRCQRFDFRRIPLSALVERLAFIAREEKIEVSDEALELIGRSATGSFRDAINLLDQLADSYGRQLGLDQVREGLGMVVDSRSAELARHVLHNQLAEGLALIATVRDDGLDLRQFQRQVVAYLRGLLLAKAGAPSDAFSEEQLAEQREVVAAVPAERIVAALRAFGEADLRADPLSSLPLELALATCTLALQQSEVRPPAPAPTPTRAASAPAQSRPAPASRVVPPTAVNQPPAPRSPAGRPKASKDAQEAAEHPSNGEAPTEPAIEIRRVAPVDAAPTADSDEMLAHARERWQELYDRARAVNNVLGALLNSECGIVGVSSDEIIFGFRRDIHYQKMLSNGDVNVRALQQVVDEVLGPGRTVRCVQDANVEAQRPARGGHLVRAVEELGGQVLSGN